MSKSIYVLSPSEVEILKKGMTDPDYITGYFFRADGEERGWYFDYKFDKEGAWQKRMHSAIQKLIVVIGGVGTGKTLGVGVSAACWALTTDGFKFLNVAQKEWQARLMYDLILDLAQDTPFGKLIWSAPQRPYPKIIIKFKLGKRTYTSTLEFMSVDRDARGIFSWRGDWINVEEAGLLDNLDEIARNLSTRLTGATKMGRAFLGRFSFISNPWDTPHLWILFDLAASDPDKNLSIVISTRHNHNVSDEQIANMIKHIPEDERPRFLDGMRPEGKGNYFAKEAIYKCEDKAWGELHSRWVKEGRVGYIQYTMEGAGITHFQMPKEPGRMYFLTGDPGAGEAPYRNSPVIMVWDVTDFPSEPMKLRAFWWGSGFGRISPFIDRLLEWQQIYSPFFIGIDSTGPQKSLAELINIQKADDDITPISGLDFSGPRKTSYLVAARLIVENGLARWPKSIAGMRAQLANYDPMKDQGSKTKIPQDIVATFAMACFAVRSYFGISFEEYLEQNTLTLAEELNTNSRTRRLHKLDREQRAVVAR